MQGMVEERISIGASQATIIYSHPLQSCIIGCVFTFPQELQKPKMIKKYCYYLMVPDIMATFAATTSDVNICDCPKQGQQIKG